MVDYRPRDNIALRHLAERLDLGYDLFDAIAKAEKSQAENMAKEILKHGTQHILYKRHIQVLS